MMDSGELLLQQILLGGRLSDKLAGADIPYASVDLSVRAPVPMIESPGRNLELAPSSQGSSAFPKRAEIIRLPSARGRLLHFFANHELLAIETMAYVLLRFPDAPEGFRKGVFRVLQEEQRHLNRYLERMNEYGVTFGEVPLNLYFWNTLKAMRSPLDFVTQMSLTFEQANLDFALEYATLFETELTDSKTAVLLREVHDDEIRHVEHGWKWFQEWRTKDQRSDFDAYREALPFPMTPRRARGSSLFAADSRLKAGLPPEFIREVKIAGGSRGRVPDFYFFNPQCEVEEEFQALPKTLLTKISDLEPLLLWLAREEDVALLSHRPNARFLEQLHDLKGEIPEIITSIQETSRFAAFQEFKPWGFSRSSLLVWDQVKEKVRKKPPFSFDLHREVLFSKAFWKRHLGTAGTVLGSESEVSEWLKQAKKEGVSYLIKSARGTSGRGHLRLDASQIGDPALHRKLSKRISEREGLIVEPFYEKVFDFSVQYEIKPDQTVKEFEPRLFKVDSGFQYEAAFLGRSGFGAEADAAFSLIQAQASTWRKVHERVLSELKSQGYQGPLGIDAMVAQGANGERFVVPVIEVNVRVTMGRVAHEIELAARKRGGFRNGIWKFLSEKDLILHSVESFQALSERLEREHGANFFPTTPADEARGTWTYCLLNN